MIDLPDDLKALYSALKKLPDGRIVGIHRLLYHWTMHVGITESGYDDRYCFQTEAMARDALVGWNGKGDPPNWHKHVGSGRRRHVPTGIVWHESEPVPEAVKEWHRKNPQ